MNHFALRYMCLLRKYSEAPQSNTATCFIIDDTVLEKSGVRMEGVSRVYDHVKGRCVLGYKLLLCAFFDGKTTISLIFIASGKRETRRLQADKTAIQKGTSYQEEYRQS